MDQHPFYLDDRLPPAGYQDNTVVNIICFIGISLGLAVIAGSIVVGINQYKRMRRAVDDDIAGEMVFNVPDMNHDGVADLFVPLEDGRVKPMYSVVVTQKGPVVRYVGTDTMKELDPERSELYDGVLDGLLEDNH